MQNQRYIHPADPVHPVKTAEILSPHVCIYDLYSKAVSFRLTMPHPALLPA
jgi:hypothetical protein